jgi:hypothetical protein
MEIKPVIVAKDGLARIGKDIIELKDCSTLQYVTDNIIDFVKFVVETLKTIVNGGIFYSSDGIQFWSMTASHGQESVVFCSLSNNPYLDKIITANGQAFTIKQFDQFLYDMKLFYDENGKTLHNLIQKFSIKKVTSVERFTDKLGNFNYSVSRKDDKEIEFPATISFVIPVFNHIEHETKITFDFYMEYCEGTDEPTITFKIKSLMLKQILQDVQKSIIEKYISECWMHGTTIK